MDVFFKGAAARLPLAEAVLLLWKRSVDEQRMQGLWDRFRGRNFEKVITFPVIVQLIADALLHRTSARQSFETAIEDGRLPASIQAAYKKLGRLPIPLSQAFLAEVTAAVQEVFPDQVVRQPPVSLRKFRTIIYDGKALKRVAKHLKPLRGVAGGLLGGRALVAIDWASGLALAMAGDPDGDANEIKHLQSVVDQVRERLPEPKLHTADRAFGDLAQPEQFTAVEGDHFVVRHASRTKFYPIAEPAPRVGTDERGRAYVETWGWLGSPAQGKRRRLVRCIELELSNGQKLRLITDLLDADEYPANDLLWVYAQRWNIEWMFQQVTEVFGLKQLIGGSPQACLFQFAFCMCLYNMIQVVRGYVAQTHNRQAKEVSAEKLFRDIKEHLIGWNLMIDRPQTEAYFVQTPTRQELQQRLHILLGSIWSNLWKATPHQKVHRKTPKKRTRTHHSVYRLLEAAKLAKSKKAQAP